MLGSDNTKQVYISGLDIFRFMAAVCVVAIHSFMENDRFCDAYVVRILTRWAVPFFFMVTGYFMKDDMRRFAEFWLHILIQYVFWTILYALLGHYEIWTPKNFLSALRSGLIMPFWYFPTLLLCSAFVFVLTRFIKDYRILIIICSVMFICAMMGHTFTNIRLFGFWNNGPVMALHHRIIGDVTLRDGVFWGSYYITVGYVLRHSTNDLLENNSVRMLILLVPSLILYAIEIILIVRYNTGGADITLFTVPVVILYFLIGKQIKIPQNIGEFLRHVSIYIYLVHYYFLEVFMKRFTGLLLFVLTVTTSIALSILIVSLKRCLHGPHTR